MTHYIVMAPNKPQCASGMHVCLQLLTPSTDLQLHLNPPLLPALPASTSPPISLPVFPAGEGTQLPAAHTGPN